MGNLTAFEQEATGGTSDAAASLETLWLYEEGVAAGDPYAFHGLGKQLLLHGQTVAERERGFDLLNRAVELGHAFAMNELGSDYLDPDSPDANPERGLRYFKESASRDDIYGFNNMGVVYREGLAGLDADIETAADWFRRAAEGGHPTAPAALGRLWNGGALGTAEQFETAVAWYDIGLERGDAWSGTNAAWIIANRRVEGMTQTDAAVRAAKAAALRNEEAAVEARSVLAGLPRSAIDAAAQTLVNALGGDIAVDGAFGPGSQSGMEEVLAARGEPMPPDGPVERTVALARAYWRGEAFRVDLY